MADVGREDLLEELRKAAGCNYQSDLHQKRYAQDILRALEGIGEERFSPAQWNEAGGYITGDAGPDRRHTRQTVVEHLKNAIK